MRPPGKAFAEDPQPNEHDQRITVMHGF
jgi:hypothetical protein